MKKCLLAILFLVLIFSSACTRKIDPASENSASPVSVPVDSSVTSSSNPPSSISPSSTPKQVSTSPFCLGEERFLGKAERKYEGEFEEHTEWQYEVDIGTYPRMDGSTVCVGMARAFAQEHLWISGHADMEVIFGKTHQAYVNLITKKKLDFEDQWFNRKSDMNPETGAEENIKSYYFSSGPINLILATAPSKEEKNLAKKHKVKLYMKPICLDSFILITYKSNPVDSLTVEQIQKIYTGKITNWKQVGGEDRPIKAYQRNKNSGSQTAMEETVMKGKKMMKSKTELIDTMEGLVRVIAEYDNEAGSLGYTYRYYLDNQPYDEDSVGFESSDVKILAVDGVTPDPAHMRDNSYPFTVSYYAVIRAEDRGKIPGKFLGWMLSADGQACIKKAGYCTVKE